MQSETFDDVCDNLASSLDPNGHESRRFNKQEGEKLRQVALAIENLFSQRDDFRVKKVVKQPPAKSTIAYSVTLGDDNVANLIARITGDAINVYVAESEDGVGDVSSNAQPARISLNDITPDSVDTAVNYAVAEAMKFIKVHG